MGVAFLVSILDLHSINPITRLIKAPTENVEEALERVRESLSREYSKRPVKSAKKKKGSAKAKKTKVPWKDGPTFKLVLNDEQVKPTVSVVTAVMERVFVKI